MPRKAPNQVIEHRISFSDFERDRVKELMQLQKTNSAVKGVTSSIQSVGSLVAGGGLLWASVGLVIWFGSGVLLDKAKNAVENTWEYINKEIANPISDFIVDATLEGKPQFDTEYWRSIAKQDDQRIKEAQAEVDKYALPGSQYYDREKGFVAYQELQTAVKIKKQNLELERKAREAHQDYWNNQTPFTAPTHYSQLVYAYQEQYRAWVEGGRQGDPPVYPSGDGSPTR